MCVYIYTHTHTCNTHTHKHAHSQHDLYIHSTDRLVGHLRLTPGVSILLHTHVQTYANKYTYRASNCLRKTTHRPARPTSEREEPAATSEPTAKAGGN